MGFAATSYAQNYDHAIGLRLGYPNSVSYKKFISESSAVELYGGFRSFSGYSYVRAAAAYQIHAPIESVVGLNYYYGAGAGVNIFTFDAGFNDGGNIGVNVSGYLGLEYTFADIPLVISADWVPTFQINGFGNGFGAEGGALAVRYILGRE